MLIKNINYSNKTVLRGDFSKQVYKVVHLSIHFPTIGDFLKVKDVPFKRRGLTNVCCIVRISA
jgi:hypothetical protein